MLNKLLKIIVNIAFVIIFALAFVIMLFLGRVEAAEHIAGMDVSQIQYLEQEPEEQKPADEPMFTDLEIDLLAHLAMAEAEGESLEGKIAVVQAAVNRANNRDQSIETVIFAPYQFCTSERFYLTPSEECYEAVQAVMDGQNVIPADVEYFCEKSIGFSYLEFVCQIGNHKFWR